MSDMDNHPIPDDALDSDIAILGRKGGGKSYTAKGIVERLLHLGRRVLVLDPLGVWAGLRTGADGESAGYKIAIFGGVHGDLPLDPAAAEPMARVLATENVPSVIDLSELSKTAQQAFLLRFLHELRTVNREALTIVLEEADVFAPQNPQGEDSKQLHGEIDWIARRGRFRGFRLITICQRPARLSKDVLTQANCLIIHRLPAPQDRDAARAWVEGNGDRDQSRVVFDTLAGLKVGEAWVLAQEPLMLERVEFPPIRTLDTSATPKAGEKRVEPKTLAQVDVSAIREALAAKSPEPEPKAKGASAADLTAAEERGYRRGLEDGTARGRIAGIGIGIERARQALQHLQTNDDVHGVPVTLIRDEVKVEARVKPTPQAPQPRPAGEPLGMAPSAVKIVDAIVAVYPRGLSLSAAAKRAGLSPRSSAFRKFLQQAIASPRISARGDGTYVGVAAEVGLQAPTGLEDFKRTLPPAYSRMLGVLADEPRATHTREEIAQKASVSPTSSGLGAGLRELMALGLAEAIGDGYRLSGDFL